MDKKMAGAWRKAKSALESFLNDLDTSTWKNVQEAANKVEATIQFLEVAFRRPQVWQQMAKDEAVGKGGICVEITYRDESVGMLVMEWVLRNKDVKEEGYRIKGYLV